MSEPQIINIYWQYFTHKATYDRQGTYLNYFLDAIEFPAITPVSEWVTFKINFFCAFQLVTDCPHLMKANNLFWEEWQALTSLPAVVIVCNKDDFSQPCKLMSEFQDSHFLCISAFDRVSSVYEGTDKLIWKEGHTSPYFQAMFFLW